MNFSIKLRSSLVKILPEMPPPGSDYLSAAGLRGEVISFQIAYCADHGWAKVKIRLDSPLANAIQLRSVELVPVDYLPERKDRDDDCVGDQIGLYPDLLRELPGNEFSSIFNQWRALWVTVRIPKDCPAGSYSVQVYFDCRESSCDRIKTFESPVFCLRVLPEVLPPQTLKNTHWFYADCLADTYRVEVFSEPHWRIMEKLMRNAVQHGINMILTPLFTPPLDTEVGAERPTVQLIGVKQISGKYKFDFSKLDRWINLAGQCGIEFFEFAHFFTQWGAQCTPKIMADCDGEMRRIFGWDVASSSTEYAEFLDAFLPELTAWIEERNLADHVYFHCSDEPSAAHKACYSQAFEQLRKHLAKYKIIDAMSSIDIYHANPENIPVVCEDHLNAFQSEDVLERWTYYCCLPMRDYPNRFIYMNPVRNRVLGVLLYRYRIAGFLHWGFNFYYSRLSRFPVNPYCNTTAGGAFPAGDAFLVYPGADGQPEDSIRYEVFFEALQDQRILQLLELKYGRDKLNALLDTYSESGQLTMSDFPTSEEALLELRAKLVGLVEDCAVDDNEQEDGAN